MDTNYAKRVIMINVGIMIGSDIDHYYPVILNLFSSCICCKQNYNVCTAVIGTIEPDQLLDIDRVL